MKTEHTPEPWATNGTRIESEHSHGWANDGWIIAGLEGPDAEANARRIVACVNVCAGITTEQLEMDISIGGELAIYDSMKSEIECLREWQSTVRNSSPLLMRAELAEKQRDGLLAAVEAIEIDAEECLDFDECTAMLVPIDTYHKLMEAIANVKEK